MSPSITDESTALAGLPEIVFDLFKGFRPELLFDVGALVSEVVLRGVLGLDECSGDGDVGETKGGDLQMLSIDWVLPLKEVFSCELPKILCLMHP